MRRPFLLLCSALIAVSATSVESYAEIITDTFGQKVEANADAIVRQARELRLRSKDDTDLDKSIALLKDIVKRYPEYYRAWYNLALVLYKKHDKLNEEIEQAYDTAIAIHKKLNLKDGSVFNSAGWTYLNERSYEKAEKLLLQGLNFEAISTETTNALLFYNLGRLYFETGDSEKATTYLTKAVDKRNPLAKQLLDIAKRAPKRS